MTYKITLTNEQLALVLKSLGREKSRLNDGGFYRSAHLVSDLLAHFKDNAKEVVAPELEQAELDFNTRYANYFPILKGDNYAK
jgi:hypothetical protein